MITPLTAAANDSPLCPKALAKRKVRAFSDTSAQSNFLLPKVNILM